ncbi:MAG: prepilin-type N-terminal cleavage/methylation domain-containing protein [Rhodocyclaceae bacterium]
MNARGFTLVELIIVIVITGIIAASFALFFKPAIEGYLDTRRRADLTDMADTALRRIAQDVRRAVPNSLRAHSATCVQLVPTIAGGRYRMASDTVNDTPPLPCTPGPTCSAPLDTSVATTVFDVLSPLEPLPSVGDWVVIDNQNNSDVYAGVNRGQIGALATPRPSDGLHRVTIGATQFPGGYDGGRFVVIANGEQSVFYHCVGNVLYRTVAGFGAGAAACNATTGAVVASDVSACTFVYDPNHGATQQSGFLWMRLELSRAGESVALAHGMHVENWP